VVQSEEGQILSVKIAADGQWRFPVIDSLPPTYEQCLLEFEDKHFYKHPGVNPFALLRATVQNIRSRKIVSGGSTISMQCIRIAKGNPKRNLWIKCLEMFQAIRLELKYSKAEILRLYASIAPFGGNIVGLEAASWRYFGRNSEQLSIAETATLAVLPNAPALIYPGKNQKELIAKRNRLLKRLFESKKIDEQTLDLALDEPVPSRIYTIIREAPHLLDRIVSEGGNGQRIRTSLDYDLQLKVNGLANRYHNVLHQNEIHNLAVLVLDLQNGEVKSYCGNSNCSDEEVGQSVDLIQAKRSSGSILKPFLYHGMIRDGMILPYTLLPDIPTNFGGYAPKNFDERFDGAVHADEALARSLNVPAVRSLQEYGIEKLHKELNELGLTSIDNSPSHYGLSLILGGAETRLFELCEAYMNLARSISDLKPIHASYKCGTTELESSRNYNFDRGAAWWTAEALKSLNRPESEQGWKLFSSSQKIAWKTGTSFGFRDAWSIGFNSRYLVGVWIGNADGEGRPGLTGTNTAAPLMFNVFKELETQDWFDKPMGSLKAIEVCKKSGYKAQANCIETELKSFPRNSNKSRICPYHEEIHLDEQQMNRVHGNCYPVNKIRRVKWFILPAVQAYYYRTVNPSFEPLPDYKSGCNPTDSRSMEMIYPTEDSRIKIPKNLDESLSKLILQLSHLNNSTRVYWHLDEKYLGSTLGEHTFEILPKIGSHVLSCVDENGETIDVEFDIIQ